ncbi:hypothetical protein GGX14DRAFT_542308 [Mycena pura]|uniref:Uncharacterized protein n=1 Tax=Mycena pura TaxID=153505 RepID=A0AAD6VIT8_9AGAR|nr:hypothetical protein GGX14DRAFT_542308 [Mycena pura]
MPAPNVLPSPSPSIGVRLTFTTAWPSEVAVQPGLDPGRAAAPTFPLYKKSVRRRRIADVFDLVISTVADIRSLVAQYGPSRSAVPFISSWCESWRTFRTHHLCAHGRRRANPDEFEGVATLLIWNLKSLPERATLPAIWNANIRIPHFLTSQVPLPSKFLSMLIFCRVLDDTGTHTWRFQSLISHASDMYGESLGPSSVFEPELSGVVAKLVLSLLDNTTVALGAFDLTDASSALGFAQFILHLSPDFSFISERVKADTPRQNATPLLLQM